MLVNTTDNEAMEKMQRFVTANYPKKCRMYDDLAAPEQAACVSILLMRTTYLRCNGHNDSDQAVAGEIENCRRCYESLHNVNHPAYLFVCDYFQDIAKSKKMLELKAYENKK